MYIPIEKIQELIETAIAAKKKKAPFLILEDTEGNYSFHIAVRKTPKKKSLLCRIGWHDWKPASGPDGMPSGMGYGAGLSAECSRCGKGGTFSDFGVY